MAATATLATTILFFLAFSSAAAATCNEHDHAALLAFASSFPYNNLAEYWTNASECCSWDYVGCDAATGRVTSLDFSGYSDDPPAIDLKGSIPASIGDLSALESISFDHMPGLVGPLPPQLTKLEKLQYLAVTDTQISGLVPSFLSLLPSLKQINLADNKLVGTIPSSLGSMATLTGISLSGNQLTGAIPASLFSRLAAGSLAYLDLSSNKLTGTVPRSFADVPFNNINLYSNQLTGDASFLFGASKPAQQIIFSYNNIAFDLTNVEYPEKNLEYVDISHNKNIYGSISNQITNVPNLNTFDVSYNKLCGKIPTGGNLDKFPVHFYEHNKCLCGAPLPACK